MTLAAGSSRQFASTLAEPGPSSAIPTFAPAISYAFERLHHLPESVDVPKGTTLIEQGASGPTVDLILRGLVKLIFTDSQGRQATLGLRSAGWYSGATAAMVNAPSVYAVITLTECTVIRVNAAEFSLKLMQSARMMRHFLETISTELITQATAQAEVMSSSAEHRLSTFMRERDQQHLHSKVLDPLPMLKQVELAQLLGITPEHLSRLLHRQAPGKRDTA